MKGMRHVNKILLQLISQKESFFFFIVLFKPKNTQQNNVVIDCFSKLSVNIEQITDVMVKLHRLGAIVFKL